MRIVRVMQCADRAEVAAIERQCFSCPESEESLGLYDGERGVGYVVVEFPEESHLCTMCSPKPERIVAYGTMFFAPDEGQIVNIATHPDHRRRGAAGMVLDALIADARRRAFSLLSLEVRVSNAPAIGLYASRGFVTAGTRKRFYRCPTEDAYVMLKELT